MPGRAPGPGAFPRLLERDGIGRFMHLRTFIDRSRHEPARPVYLAILAVKMRTPGGPVLGSRTEVARPTH
jgi:hypothetical protein